MNRSIENVLILVDDREEDKVEYYTPRMDGDTLVFPIYFPENFRAPFVDPLTATGPAVLEIFANPDKYAGKSLPVIGDIISPSEIVETFRRVTGKKAAYRSAFTREELLHHFPAFGANELWVRELLGMAEYAVEYGYYRKDRDLLWSRQVNPSSVHSNLCVGNRPRAALVTDELGPLRHAARSHRKPLDLCRPSRPASVASFAPR